MSTAAASTGRPDIVIAGAGPVGLATALALAHRGVRSTVLEQKAVLDPHSRATLIVPRALEILDGLGVLPRLLAQGRRNCAIEILRAGDHHPILTFDFTALADVTATPFAVAIPQDRTEAILLDAVRATGLVDVRFDTPLHRFVDHPHGVTVETARGEQVGARYLVGADGAHSAVRDQLGWPLTGTTYPTRAFLADVQIAPEADLQQGWLADPKAASFTLAIRFGDGLWRLIESAIPDTITDTDLDRRATTLTEQIFGHDTWRATLWTAAYRKHERRADRYHDGHVVLAGDAAHLNSPAGGQGLNSGLQDAHSLAWRLARILDGRGDPQPLLASYTHERTRSFDADIRALTGGIERMETLPARLRAVAFSAVGMLRATPLPATVARKLSMLDPTLTPSALLHGPAPVGARMPNTTLPDGTRLYHHIGPDGLLLTRPGTPATPGVTHADMPAGLRAPFVGHTALFIRPDHIVAAATNTTPGLSVADLAHALGDTRPVPAATPR